MAEVNTSAKTTPKTSMKTELWYAVDGGTKTQIFMVQSIPQLQTPQEPITYGSLESSTEFQTKGTRKAESIAIPVLYVAEQHTALKALADANSKLTFYVKFPDSTAPTSEKPLTYTFTGTIDLANDEISIDGMLAETITIYRDSVVTETTWTE